MNAFAEVLKVQTRKKGVSVGKLCEGLCSQSMYTRICNGERVADKLLRERLMHRLGLSDTRNESFLFRDEHLAWKQRQRILNRINREQFVQAGKLLRQYKDHIALNNNLEQQFCMVMEMQILIGQGLEGERLQKITEKALKLTVPNIDSKPLGDLILSEQEIDLILEYVRYCHPAYMSKCCDELLNYINHAFSDEYMKVKILPKIVYYQCKGDIEQQENVEWGKLLKNCNKAIACLRETQRLYYFWELLGEREKIYNYFLHKAKKAGEKKHSKTFKQMQKENTLWKQTLEEIYRDCEINPAMKNNCYLYLQKNTFCINDILYRRRSMLGMTRKALGEGICSEKTIARAELTSCKMQLAITRELLKKLGMSGEYHRVDVITSNPEAMDILRSMAKHSYDRDYKKEHEELELLEEMIPMDNPINQQYIKKAHVLLMRSRGELSDEKALQELKEALEYTIPINVVENGTDLCLTNGEMTCLINMAFIQGTNQLNSYHKILQRICENYEREDEVSQNISMYEFIMAHIASVLGNMGYYEKSNENSLKIIRENVFMRRFGNIADGIYNIAYNYKKQKSSSYKEEVWRKNVRKSATFFHMAKCYNIEKILEEKLR